MYRFRERKGIKHYTSGIKISILVFVLLLIYFVFALKGISQDTLDRQEESLTSAVNRAIVSCYCVEGTYPPNLDYLISHYGITYDKETFFIDYQSIGSNIYPDVTIIRKVQEIE